MTFKQLECFLVLAQRLNFTQAAQALYMAQPALSRTISALEEELGLPLFYRNSRNVALTPAGLSFARSCPKLLEEYRMSLASARQASEGYQGKLTLGVLRDNFDAQVVDLFHTMAAKYPEVCLELRECSHSELYHRFDQGQLDAMVTFGSFAPAEDTRQVILRRDRQCVVVPSTSRYAGRPHVQMEELRDERFIAMARTASQPGHDFLFRLAGDAGFVPNVVAEASYVQSLLMLVACGLGLTTLTDDLACQAQGRVTFVPLLGVPLSYHALLWKQGSKNPSLPFLVETARGLPSGAGG